MRKITLILLLFSLIVSQAMAKDYLVKDIDQYNASLELVKPGDKIIMANGIWTDVQLIFKATGTEDNPIFLTAETPGQVSIEGQSNLVLQGDYLHVSGLLFTNGYSPEKSVISFAISPKNPSNHCRVTECAIVDFSKSERFDKDNWVAVYGKHNRFDHNYLAGKLNAGVTMAVYLNDVKGQDNHHQIDHNYFGERKRLGSNGGETLRVGTSTYSLVPANTTIEDNYFERCNGEVEAMSIKATGVTIRRNTFFETEGCLALRHGNNNKVYENIFIGNGKVSIGGLRIINAGHEVHDNYFFKVTGERFRAALAVMDGVPNSAINRYHQVKDVNMYNNMFIDCDYIEFGVGVDNERTATPISSTFSNNVIYQTEAITPISFLDDMSGIDFKDNQVYSPNFNFSMEGFVQETMILKKDKSGFYQAVQGKPKKQEPVENYKADDLVQKQNAGPQWLQSILTAENSSGTVIEVSNKAGQLQEAFDVANSGDTLILTSAGTYTLSDMLQLDKTLVLMAAADLDEKPIIIYNDEKSGWPAHILLLNGGNLFVQGIAFNGTTVLGNTSASAIRTDKKGMNKPYKLHVEDCEFYNFNESSYSAFRAEKSSYAESIVFNSCLFHTFSGDAISLSAEKDDRGIYNAEYVTLYNCIFYNVMGAALDLYRGGNDESTLGPYLDVNHCLFENVNNKELGSVLRLIGVQVAVIRNSIFSNSGQGGRTVKFEETRWNDCEVINCNLYNSGRIESFYGNVTKGEVYEIEPVYIDESGFDFRLKNQSEFNKETTIGLIY